MMTPSAPRWVSMAFFAVATALLAAWTVAIPVFEAPDEPAHWQYARHLHDHWSLPPYERGFEEGNSPPLYYMAIAPVAVPSRLPPMAVGENPEGVPAAFATPRVFLSTDRDFAWYWPVFAARLITAVMALLTVWITYRMASEVTDWRGGLIAASIVLFLPQFSFRNVTVSNDAPVTMFAAAIAWSSVRMLQRGFTWRRGVVAVVLWAAAYLSKIHAIALVAPMALAMVEAPGPSGERPTLRARLARLSVWIVPFVIVLPWSIRNVMLYGDPFAAAAMSQAVPHLIGSRSLFSSYFLWHFPTHLTTSFIGIFGWANVVLGKKVYAACGLIGLIVAAGLLRAWIARTADRRLVRTLVLTVIAIVAIVVYMNLRLTQPQGRYLLPALPAMALLAVFGIASLPAAFAARAHVIVPVALALFNLWSLVFVLIPAYYPPLVHNVSAGTRVLFPAVAYHMHTIPDQVALERRRTPPPIVLEFRVADERPAWVVPADIDAAAFSTLEFELTSELPGSPTINGTVLFAPADQPLGNDRRVDFTWSANGTRQVLRLDMAAHPLWRGEISHIRIDPITGGAGPFVGRGVRLGEIRVHSGARSTP